MKQRERTSLTKRPGGNLPGGFTILEIVMVMAVVTLLIGAAIPEISGMVRAERLKAPARELEGMAITARYQALAEQRPYQIILSQKGFRLERLGDAKTGGVVATYDLADDIALELATWPEEKWSQPRQHVWYFPPSGLCEPIRIMFRKGEAYFYQKYSAVTGWYQEESLVVP